MGGPSASGGSTPLSFLTSKPATPAGGAGAGAGASAGLGAVPAVTAGGPEGPSPSPSTVFGGGVFGVIIR